LWASPISGPPTFHVKIGIFFQIVNINVQKVCQSAPKHTIGRLKTKKISMEGHSPLPRSPQWGWDTPPGPQASILAPSVLVRQIWPAHFCDAPAAYDFRSNQVQVIVRNHSRGWPSRGFGAVSTFSGFLVCLKCANVHMLYLSIDLFPFLFFIFLFLYLLKFLMYNFTFIIICL